MRCVRVSSVARSCATRNANNNKDNVCKPTILAGINRPPPSKTISPATRVPDHLNKRDNIFRFKWERNDAISLATVKMGLVIPISHGGGNLRITNYRGKYRDILPWYIYREEPWKKGEGLDIIFPYLVVLG